MMMMLIAVIAKTLAITGGIEDNLTMIFLFLIESICCDSSLEPSR